MTVLTKPQYDESYYRHDSLNVSNPHKAGYQDYLEGQVNWKEKQRIQRFLTRHNIPKDAKILELGSAIGFMGKIATEEGYTNWTCVDWSSWVKANEVFPVIEQDALSYLQAQADNSFDYIITRALIECLPTNQLQNHATETKRVATKQIHTTYLSGNTTYYNIKTLPDWTSNFLNDPDIIVEDYFKDG